MQSISGGSSVVPGSSSFAAEMIVPGKAWLQFETSPLDQKNRAHPDCLFFPKAVQVDLLVWLYHSSDFGTMIKKIARVRTIPVSGFDGQMTGSKCQLPTFQKLAHIKPCSQPNFKGNKNVPGKINTAAPDFELDDFKDPVKLVDFMERRSGYWCSTGFHLTILQYALAQLRRVLSCLENVTRRSSLSVQKVRAVHKLLAVE
jgi:hypothetical protein